MGDAPREQTPEERGDRRVLPPPGIRAGILLLSVALLLSVIVHAKSFYVPHAEGDELVYLSLAREMNWNLSHYTTRDDPDVSRFPYSIYRAPLFHHPPLFALVLKAGGLFGRPVLAGLLFQNLAMFLLLLVAWRVLRFFQIAPDLHPLLYSALVLCHFISFSTTRLHHDALAAIFLFCGIMLFMEALEMRSACLAAASALLLVLALNTRYTTLAALPLLFGVQALHLFRLFHSGGAEGGQRPAAAVLADRRSWDIFLPVFLLVATVGLHHYYRVLWQYGTLLPGGFIQSDGAERSNYFLYRVSNRSRWQIAAYFLTLFPAVLLLFHPQLLRHLRRMLREGSWACVPLAAGPYLFAVTLIFSHRQLRYFAPALPFAYLAAVLLVDRSRGLWRSLLLATVVLTLFLMGSTTFYSTAVQPEIAEIIPSLFVLFPPLEPSYF
ncbi:hypothetical protein ACFL2P_03050 [Candidatus Moduliflexota bacterium]